MGIEEAAFIVLKPACIISKSYINLEFIIWGEEGIVWPVGMIDIDNQRDSWDL